MERRLIARQLLDQGEHAVAYEVARAHQAASPANRIEAEFHAGWIALRFLARAEDARRHFDMAASLAETPISVARAAYWQGRAAERLGDADGAQAAFTRAAAQSTAYYGQLARTRLGLTDLALFTEARYTRHPSQADLQSAFQDHPVALEHIDRAGVGLAAKLGGDHCRQPVHPLAKIHRPRCHQHARGAGRAQARHRRPFSASSTAV